MITHLFSVQFKGLSVPLKTFTLVQIPLLCDLFYSHSLVLVKTTLQNRLLTIHFNIGHRRDTTHKVGSRALVMSGILPLDIGNRESVVT